VLCTLCSLSVLCSVTLCSLLWAFLSPSSQRHALSAPCLSLRSPSALFSPTLTQCPSSPALPSLPPRLMSMDSLCHSANISLCSGQYGVKYKIINATSLTIPRLCAISALLPSRLSALFDCRQWCGKELRLSFLTCLYWGRSGITLDDTPLLPCHSFISHWGRSGITLIDARPSCLATHSSLTGRSERALDDARSSFLATHSLISHWEVRAIHSCHALLPCHSFFSCWEVGTCSMTHTLLLAIIHLSLGGQAVSMVRFYPSLPLIHLSLGSGVCLMTHAPPSLPTHSSHWGVQAIRSMTHAPPSYIT
jgi:hypothetical protein